MLVLGILTGTPMFVDLVPSFLPEQMIHLQVILIPDPVSQASLIMLDVLSQFQRDHCILMQSRSYSYKAGSLTGANALLVARIGMDKALLTTDSVLLTDAYLRAHNELVIKNTVRADGIRADGAFGMFHSRCLLPAFHLRVGQHDGLLYNGHYGKLTVSGMRKTEVNGNR